MRDSFSTGTGPRPVSAWIDFLFFVGLALLVCHELDAVAQSEWRLLWVLGNLPEQTARTAFVALHVPLFAVLFWLTGSSARRIRLVSQAAVDAFLVIHAGLHWRLNDHEFYTFHSALSELLIFGGGAVGLAHLVVLLSRRSLSNSRWA